MAKEEEYKELFLSEAQDSYEKLNDLFVQLEKDSRNRFAVDAIFRITHTLKGNAMGLGFDAIAELSHVMEEIFNELKLGKIELYPDLFAALFRANDILGALIQSIKTGEIIRHKGITTKLTVALRNAKELYTLGSFSKTGEQQTENKQGETVEDDKLFNFIAMELDENDFSIAIDEVLETEGESEYEHKVVLSDMVQVPVRKLDKLLNIVGELLIEKDRLLAQSDESTFGSSDLARLHRITSDLQYQVMDVRLVQVGFLFKKFNRVLRDAAIVENKKVALFLEGTESEIDRNILTIISDSLVHLVRNAVSHGIELPEQRIQAGKPEEGRVTLSARNEKDTIVIEIKDDGAGIDAERIKRKAIEKGILTEELARLLSKEEIIFYIFEPGFSNAEKITEISGRGVGLDVVRSAVESMGGKIAIYTEISKGTSFVLSLPSSMAVKGALLFMLDEQQYAIALTYTEAVIALRKADIHKISNGLISKYLGKTISIIFLRDLFNMNTMREISERGALHRSFDKIEGNPKLDVVIVSHNNRLVGIVVDQLSQQKEIFEKTLSAPIDHVDLFSGATILGNGGVCLVLDIARILSSLYKEQMAAKLNR